MKRWKTIACKQESGLTLVEVLASIVILSLVLVSILMILVQTAKTNKVSEEIIDATYLAQKEIENIYQLSKKDESLSLSYGYEKKVTDDGNGWTVYHKGFEEDSDYYIQVRIKDTEDEMTRVVVEIIEKNSTKVNAQMENLFQKWEWAE